MNVSCGGLLTRSGSLVSIEDMSPDVVVNSAVATQHFARIFWLTRVIKAWDQKL